MNVKKDVKKLRRAAQAAGFEFVERSKHVKVVAPDGSVFGLSRTPSDPGSWHKICADFRRRGLEI